MEKVLGYKDLNTLSKILYDDDIAAVKKCKAGIPRKITRLGFDRERSGAQRPYDVLRLDSQRSFAAVDINVLLCLRGRMKLRLPSVASLSDSL
jgi:hypothetical protein